LSILVFALWEGPSWRHADAADAAAWWSYAVIAPLVAGALIFERKLRGQERGFRFLLRGQIVNQAFENQSLVGRRRAQF
jgi:hypothetical protein